jgi:lysophospholipase L1-like esterase
MSVVDRVPLARQDDAHSTQPRHLFLPLQTVSDLFQSGFRTSGPARSEAEAVLTAEVLPVPLRPAFLLVLILTVFAVATARSSSWAGTWATAAQPFMPGTLETYDNQTLRLIVHTSVAGSQVRITLSNLYGTVPLQVGAAHIGIRASGANIDPRSDRPLRFGGQSTVTVPAHGQVTSDPVSLRVAALSDLAISLFLPHKVQATTSHLLALQTSYVSAGNTAAAANFPILQTIDTWPFLTTVDVTGAEPLSAVAVVGSSTTDGDGATQDQNRRMPDALAKRLHDAGGAHARIGVLNAGIIGNRLLKDSPPKFFGAGLGEAVLARLDRDALDQAGVQFIIVAIGVNDIAFPGAFTHPDEAVSAESLIAGYREIIGRAHRKGIRVLMTTIPPFRGATHPKDETLALHTPEKEAVRLAVNEWIRATKEADGVADFDAVLRDPAHPDKLLERFDIGDHLHANDAGYAASAATIPLSFFSAHIASRDHPGEDVLLQQH